MQVKQLDRAATIAWNPSEKHRSLLVSGTMAGTIDDSFQTNSHLEIYSVDLTDPSQNMKLLGNVVTKDCFNKIAWGGKGMDDPNGTLGAGLIAGGMSDGSINLWNAQAVMKGERMSLLARAEHHRGPVLGLEFHPQHTNLLASGSSDAEVYVWDLQSVSAPKPSKPHSRTTPLNSGITCLSWNKKVPQILATSSEIGETNVWDLRQKRAVLTFREESHAQIRASGLAWNPNQPVQIAVCYATPTVEIWDLRRSMSPEIKLQGGHGGPVMGLAWNPHDPNLLFSSGNDGNVVAWNVPQGQRLDTFNFEGAIFDMQWAPNMPSFLSCSSVDGRVSIRSVHNFGYYVPSWLKRPVGAQFAFGGKLVSFSAPAAPEAATPEQPAAPETPPGQIKIQQVSTDGALIDRAEQFQQALNNGDFVGFCNQKIQAASSEQEKQIWSFMRLLFESESDQKAQSLRFLGYESAAPPKPAAEEPKQNGAPPAEPVRPKPAPKLADANQFFDSLASEPAPEEPETNGTSEHDSDEGEATKTVPGKEGAEAKKADVFVPENEDDIAIKKALIVGDFQTAVDRCLAADRIADALIFASCGGGSLWSKVQDAFFAKHPQQFVRNVIRGIVKGDLKQTVQSSDLKNWRETLAILMVYAESQSFRELAASLAERLDRELRDSTAATIVYMCSGNMEQAAAIWARSVKGSNLPALQEAIEKIAVFGRAIKGSAQASPLLSAKYAEYASWLVSQGKLAAAFRYLEVASPGTTGDVEISGDASSDALKDRIFQALPEADKQFLPPPRFPYHKIHVSSPYATPAHAHHGHPAQHHPQQHVQQQQAQQQQQQQGQQQARSLAPGRPGAPGGFQGAGGFPGGQPNQPNPNFGGQPNQPNPNFGGQPNQPNPNFPGGQPNPNFPGSNQPQAAAHQPQPQPGFGGQPGGWKPATPNPPNAAANATGGFSGAPLMGGARPPTATPSPGPSGGAPGGSLPLRPPGTAVPASGYPPGPTGPASGVGRPPMTGMPGAGAMSGGMPPNPAVAAGGPPRPAGPAFPGAPGPNAPPNNMGAPNTGMPPNPGAGMPSAGPSRPSIPNLGPNMPQSNPGLPGPSAAAAGTGTTYSPRTGNRLPRGSVPPVSLASAVPNASPAGPPGGRPPMPGGPAGGFPPSASPPPANPSAFPSGPNNGPAFASGPSQPPAGAFPGPGRPGMPPTGPASAPAVNPATPARPPLPGAGGNMASPGPGPAVGQPGMPPRPVGPAGPFNPAGAPSPAAPSPNPAGPGPAGPGPAGFPARPGMPAAAPMRPPMPGGAPMGSPMPGGSPAPNAGAPGPNNPQPGFRPAPGPMNAGPMNPGPGPMNAGPVGGPPKPAGPAFNQPPGPYNNAPAMGQPPMGQPNAQPQPPYGGQPAGGMPPGPGGFYGAPQPGRYGAMPAAPYNPRPPMQ